MRPSKLLRADDEQLRKERDRARQQENRGCGDRGVGTMAALHAAIHRRLLLVVTALCRLTMPWRSRIVWAFLWRMVV
jgi:hypothetical protein